MIRQLSLWEPENSPSRSTISNVTLKNHYEVIRYSKNNGISGQREM